VDHTTLAVAAQQAYRINPTLSGYVTHFIRRGPVEVAVFVSQRNIVVAFRGTEAATPGDWEVDLRCTKTKLGGTAGRWHKGFAEALWQVQLHIESRIGFTNRTKPIYITGHSLGGALAVLHAALLRDEEHRVQEIVTFGAPRVGNRPAAEWLERKYPGKIVQYEHAGDRVPHLPPTWMGYCHVGQRIYLGGRSRSWWDRLRIVTRGMLGVDRHKMAAYLEGIFQREKGG
jgi:predicted lipase